MMTSVVVISEVLGSIPRRVKSEKHFYIVSHLGVRDAVVVTDFKKYLSLLTLSNICLT